MVPMVDLNPTIAMTDNSTHGVSGDAHSDRGGPNASDNSGMSCEVSAVPNVGKSTTVKEFPSLNAGIAFGGDHDVVNPMDTD